MKKLWKIEWLKTWNNTPFKVLLLLHFVLFFLVVYIFSKVEISVPGFSIRRWFAFPDIWDTLSWIASWFNLLLAILMIVLVGNEYSFRTNRQQVMNGLGRMELLAGKGLVAFFIMVYGMVLVFLSSLVLGCIYTSGLSFSLVFENARILLVYAVQLIAYLSLAILLTLIIRNNAVSILSFIFYFALIEPVLRRFFPMEARSYFPVRVISHLTPMPGLFSMGDGSSFSTVSGSGSLSMASMGLGPEKLSTGTGVILSLGYVVLFVLGSAWLLKKRDL